MNKRRNVIFLMALFALLLVLSYQVARPFIGPAIMACILAVGFLPAHRRIERVLKRPSLAALASILVVYSLIIVPLVFVGTSVAEEVQSQYQALQKAAEDYGGVTAYVRNRGEFVISFVAPRLNMQPDELAADIGNRVQAAVQFALQTLAAGVVQAGSFLFNAFLAAIILFFFLRDGRTILQTLVEVLPLRKTDTQTLLDVIGESLTANVYGVVGVALVQGILTGIALAIAGISSALTWTVIATIFAMLPVVGPTIVWIPAAIYLLASGSYGMGLFVAAWGAVVVGLADNLLRPLLVSGRTKQHPLLVFLSILGGTSAFGLMGLFLGPLLVSVTIAVFYVLRRETSEESEVVITSAE